MTNAERERLARFIEECSEAIQAAAKILRHGWEAIDNSVTPPVHYNNRVHLATEIGHIHNTVDAMIGYRDISENVIIVERARKEQNVLPYLHYQ